MKNSWWRIAALASVALGVVAACGSGSPPPQPLKAGGSGASPAARAAAVPDAGTGEVVAYSYSYNPLGKRDPFRSPVADVATADQTGACREPLCQWEMDQLVLVGVVTGDASPLAMVQDPQGRGYLVRRATKMGKQGGQVTQILRDSVTVTEFFQTADGKRVPNTVTMHLKAELSAAPDMDLYNNKLVTP